MSTNATHTQILLIGGTTRPKVWPGTPVSEATDGDYVDIQTPSATAYAARHRTQFGYRSSQEDLRAVLHRHRGSNVLSEPELAVVMPAGRPVAMIVVGTVRPIPREQLQCLSSLSSGAGLSAVTLRTVNGLTVPPTGSQYAQGRWRRFLNDSEVGDTCKPVTERTGRRAERFGREEWGYLRGSNPT